VQTNTEAKIPQNRQKEKHDGSCVAMCWSTHQDTMHCVIPCADTCEILRHAATCDAAPHDAACDTAPHDVARKHMKETK
jgi:hypothetical protein